MAHPFRYFRKHQKAFLAVAAVIAMFVFVVGDAFFGYIGQGGGPDPNKEVASWKGGRLTAMELETLTQRRYFISQFLQTLMMTGAQRLMAEGGNPMQPSVPNFILNEGTTPYDVSVNVVSTRILADQARKAGITISDDVINHFLKEVSFRRVSDGEIVTLLQRMRGGDVRGLEEQLFAGLRELLLGNAYMTSYSGNIRNVLPEQRWDDWRRINERVSLEVAEVDTSDFVKEVPDPKDTELRKFYEEYKNAIGHQSYLVMGTELPSANPGFKQPRRVKLNYLLGDVTAWSEKFKDSITEEEIADYYERNKRTQFVKSGDTPVFDESLFGTETKPEDESASAGEETSESTTAPADIETGTSENSATEPSSSGGDVSEDSVPVGEDEAPKDDESSAVERSNFRLAAFQANDEKTETAADEIADDAAGTEEAAGEPASAGDAATVSETADTKTDEEKPVDYEPLDAVRDTIRNKLATDKAVVELKKVMDKIFGEMQSEYNPYGFSVVTARSEKKEAPTPPEALTNLKARATETGLISEETVLLTRRELADTAVGKAADVQTQSRPVWYAAFDDLELYEPLLSQDIDGNLYLVTKVEDEPEKVPAFEDIREEVLRAWKKREAAKLALQKAEEFAAEAQKADDTLATYFIGKPYDVITTDMFSWLTFGATPAELQRGAKLGDAPPLEAVGPDFMEKVFELKDGEVAALLNYDESKAYLFRLDRRESTPEELKSLFLREANNWYGGQVMMLSRLQYQQQQVLEQVLKRVDFDEKQLQEFLQPATETAEN